MAAWGAVPSPPPKSSLQSSKSLEHWRTEIVTESWSSERPYGCQEELLIWCLLQDSPVLHLWHLILRGQEGFLRGVLVLRTTIWMPGTISLFVSPCHLTHQDSTCPPSLELDPWRTGKVPDRSLHLMSAITLLSEII